MTTLSRMTDVDWAGLRERIAAIALAEGSRRVFGASGHEFVLHPSLAMAELLELEQAIGAPLPEDYRAFLLDVGNGGAGPGYGIERVGRTAGGWHWTGHRATAAAELGVPFQPFDPQVYADHEAAEPMEDDFSDHDAFMHAYRVWVRVDDDLHDRETFGAITLSQQGCGTYWLLAVSGPDRGTMWDDGRASDVPLSRMTDLAGRPLTFRQWYLDWLTMTEAAAAERP
jgi:hypothetical protein